MPWMRILMAIAVLIGLLVLAAELGSGPSMSYEEWSAEGKPG